MIWDDARDLRAIDVGDAPVLPDPTHKYPSSSRVTSTFARPRCQSVRVEHVLITTDDVMAGKGPRFGVLEKRILHSALQLQKSIEAEIRRDPDDDRLYSRPICLQARSSFQPRSRSTRSGRMPYLVSARILEHGLTSHSARRRSSSPCFSIDTQPDQTWRAALPFDHASWKMASLQATPSSRVSRLNLLLAAGSQRSLFGPAQHLSKP